MGIYHDNQNELPLFQFELLRGLPDVVHGISTRQAPGKPLYPQGQPSDLNAWEVSGSRNRAPMLADPDRYDKVIRWRRMEFLAALGLEPETAITSLTAGQQRHTANVAVVGPEAYGAELNWGRSLPEIDGVVTDRLALPLLSIHADCPPLLFYDPVRKVAATVHSGWRGTVKKIGAVAVRTMQQYFESKPSDILAGIGPSIGPCCYEVDEPVISEVQQAFGAESEKLLIQSKTDASKSYFDLWEANRQLLVEVGLQPDHIENSEICTRCHADTFFSYRATGEEMRQREGYGLFGAIIALI